MHLVHVALFLAYDRSYCVFILGVNSSMHVHYRVIVIMTLLCTANICFWNTYALSICSHKIIFVQDKMKIVLDKIIFVQDKKFCPKLKSHFSYNSSLMMNFLSMYKIFCSGQKIFCLRQFCFCPGQKSFYLYRWIRHLSSIESSNQVLSEPKSKREWQHFYTLQRSPQAIIACIRTNFGNFHACPYFALHNADIKSCFNVNLSFISFPLSAIATIAHCSALLPSVHITTTICT